MEITPKDSTLLKSARFLFIRGTPNQTVNVKIPPGSETDETELVKS